MTDDILFAVGVIGLAFITLAWRLALLSRKEKIGPAEPLGGRIYGGVMPLLVWGAMVLGLTGRIRTGKYPLAFLRLLGFEGRWPPRGQHTELLERSIAGHRALGEPLPDLGEDLPRFEVDRGCHAFDLF